MIGLDGYTVSTGVISKELNGENLMAAPLEASEKIRVGVITRIGIHPGRTGQAYLEAMEVYTLALPVRDIYGKMKQNIRTGAADETF